MGKAYIPEPVLTGDFIEGMGAWSLQTHGPGERLLGVVDHIRKELLEVLADPKDVSEWADILILTLNGASRQGFSGQEIIHAVLEKHQVNLAREWPDWRTQDPDKAIGHVKEEERYYLLGDNGSRGRVLLCTKNNWCVFADGHHQECSTHRCSALACPHNIPNFGPDCRICDVDPMDLSPRVAPVPTAD